MSRQNDQEKAEKYFESWYIKPLSILESIPYGDGAFIALATSCFLYERYADAVQNSVTNQLMIDFGIDQETAIIFWNVMRNGILHTGMPKQKDRSKSLPHWRFQHEFIQPIKLHKVNNLSAELQVQPWLFMNKVIDLWQKNLRLLDDNNSFPWAKIIPSPDSILEEQLLDNKNVPGTISKKDNGGSLSTGTSSTLDKLYDENE